MGVAPWRDRTGGLEASVLNAAPVYLGSDESSAVSFLADNQLQISYTQYRLLP